MIVHKNLLGQLHREDGPAIECSDGSKDWYIDGHNINKLKNLFLEFNILHKNVCLQLKPKYGLYIDYVVRKRK